MKLFNRPDYPQENNDDDDDHNKDEMDEAELDLNKIEEDMLKVSTKNFKHCFNNELIFKLKNR